MKKQFKQLNKAEQERLEKRRAYKRAWGKANPEKIYIWRRRWAQTNLEKVNASSHKWRKANPEKAYASCYEWRKNNPEKVRAYNRNWRKVNPEKVKAKDRKHLATNINRRIACNLRSRLWSALLAQGAHKKGHMVDLVGISIVGLKAHIERQFTEGMTWVNYGKWHIDHIIALRAKKNGKYVFDLTKLADQKKAFHYTNLQPLWAKPNLQKGAKVS